MMDNGYYPMAEKITPKELQARKDEYVIIDVREPDELKEGANRWSNQFATWTANREANGDLDEIKRKKSILTVQVDTEEILLQTN